MQNLALQKEYVVLLHRRLDNTQNPKVLLRCQVDQDVPEKISWLDAE
jgi:hypothetical protein